VAQSARPARTPLTLFGYVAPPSLHSQNALTCVSQHFEEIFQRSLTVKGFIVYTGESAVVVTQVYDEIIPLVLKGRIASREHRYTGLKEAGKALADLHTGANTGKAIIVVAEE
jgi:NADPH-dependent curcumin reductase CurA